MIKEQENRYNLPEEIHKRYCELSFDSYRKVAEYLNNHQDLFLPENKSELPDAFLFEYIENGEHKRKEIRFFPQYLVEDFWAALHERNCEIIGFYVTCTVD